MKKIKLTKGKVTLVDNEDFDFLNQWRWKYHKDGYAVRTITGGSQVYMHRVINKTPKGLVTDHINRNGLDNRKCNLRSTTLQQNAYNTKMNKNNKSGFKGVFWNRQKQKWQASITVNQRMKYLGAYNDINEAAQMRKQGEKIYVK